MLSLKWYKALVVSLATAAIVAFVLIAGMPDAFRQEVRRAEHLDVRVFWARVVTIAERGQQDKDYTAAKFVRDCDAYNVLLNKYRPVLGMFSSPTDAQRRNLHVHLLECFAGTHAAVIAGVPMDRRAGYGAWLLEGEVAAAQQRRFAGGIRPVQARDLWYVAQMCLYFWGYFALLAAFIYALRILVAARDWRHAIALARISRTERLVAIAGWGIGLTTDGYNPAKVWQARMAELVRERRCEHRGETWEASEARVEAQVLTDAEAVLCLWRSIWGQNWPRVVLRPWTRQWRQAAYLTLVGTAYVLLQARVGAAEAEPSAGPVYLKGMQLTTLLDPRIEGSNQDTLFLFLPKGVTLILFDTSGVAQNGIEVSKDAFQWNEKGWGITAGPYVDYVGGRATSYGLTSFFHAKLGNGRLFGPVYLTGTPVGHRVRPGVFMPGMFALWPVAKQWSAGVFAKFVASGGSKPILLVGPSVERQIGKSARIRASYGFGVTDAARGVQTLRTDVSFGF